jgi:ribosome-binding ATPase
VSTRIGIVGMPNAGKSSLFNALTKAGAEAANYPFTTIEPNVAVVPVRDERLEQVSRTVGASEIVWDTIDFHDIAGLVAGAHEGEGLGNRFLANIRETDAIVHVVRSHHDDNVVHPEGRVDPLRDIETIETELVLADLEQAERRIERVARQARSGDRVAVAEEAWLREVIDALQAGRPARTVPVPKDAPNAAHDLGSLTVKPVLFVANVDEGSEELPA